MLEEITLERFKKFKDNKIILRPFSVLMGENSSGKTTILQAINTALSTFSRYDLIKWNSGKAVFRSKGIGLNTLPGIGISDFREVYYSKISRPSKNGQKGDTSIGCFISLKDSKKNTYRLQISSLFGSFNLKNASKDGDIIAEPELLNYQPLFISGFVGLLADEERSLPMAINNRLETGRVSTIIRNLLLDTKENNRENYEKLVTRLAIDFDFLLSEVEFDSQKDLYVTARYQEKIEKKNVRFDFNSSGSGFMQVLQILAPIYRYCPEKCKIVLLDEPDAHLHPNMQTVLAESLESIQEELGIQIIISTHSTHIIRKANPQNVIPITSAIKQNSPLVSGEEVENEVLKRLDSYELGKTVLSGKILFFEDANIELWEQIDKVAKLNNISGSRTVPYLCGRSKDDKVPFALKEIFKIYLKKEVDILYIRDGDGLTEEFRSKLGEYALKKGARLLMLKRHEIENYILNATLIERTLKRLNEGKVLPSISDIEKKIEEILKSTISMSRYRYDDNLEDSIYKTGHLLNIADYRNPANCKSKAIQIRDDYEKVDDISELMLIGMGKETIDELIKYLNEEKSLKISKNAIIKDITIDDIDKEILDIAKQFSSIAKS